MAVPDQWKGGNGGGSGRWRVFSNLAAGLCRAQKMGSQSLLWGTWAIPFPTSASLDLSFPICKIKELE